MRKILAGLVLAISASGDALAADRATYEALHAEATISHQAARDAGGEWRDVRTLFNEAGRAAKGGDYKKAVQHLEAAKFQSDMGVQQAKEGVNSGNPDYLY